MKETAIGECVLRHDARNLRLKRRLAEHGIDVRCCAMVRCRFLAPSLAQALLLAADLRRQGLGSAHVEPVGPEQAPSTWSLEAPLESSIEKAASHEFTEILVHCAGNLDCLYQGWSLAHPVRVAA